MSRTERQPQMGSTSRTDRESRVRRINVPALPPGAVLELVERVCADPRPAVLVFAPCDARAEARALAALDARGAEALSASMQGALARLAGHAQPVVAALPHDCHGTAWEVAIACHARVQSSAARAGWPEFTDGRAPLGGTSWRLQRIVGPRVAALFLCGGWLTAAEASHLGLCIMAEPTDVIDVATKCAGGKAATPRSSLRGLLASWSRPPSPTGSDLARGLTELVRARSWASAARREQQLAVAMVSHPSQRAQLRAAERRGTNNDAVPTSVAGCGAWGGRWALALARHGHRVHWWDVDAKRQAEGQAHLTADLKGLVERREIRQRDRDVVLGHVLLAQGPRELTAAPLVIEAVTDDVASKQAALAAIVVADDAVVLTTTCGPVVDVAAVAPNPRRVIGWYVPPHGAMVELIAPPNIDDDALKAAVGLASRLGWPSVVTRASTGPLTLRLFAALAAEAVALLRQGVATESLDDALEAWGFGKGPLRMIDDVGVDVVARALARNPRGGSSDTSPELLALAQAGRTGRKQGRGFYRYGNGARGARRRLETDMAGLFTVTAGSRIPVVAAVRRCVLRLVNEAAHCLTDGSVASAGDLDTATVLGLGFPAAHGGVWTWLETQGPAAIVRELEVLAATVGDAFTPAARLLEAARARKSV